MWSNDVPAGAPSASPATGDQTDTCATCERPVSGTLRCDECVRREWSRLRAEMGEDWYAQHRLWDRQAAGGDV